MPHDLDEYNLSFASCRLANDFKKMSSFFERRLAIVLSWLLAIVMFLFIGSCGGTSPEDSENGHEVEMSVPKSVTISSSDNTLEFKVLFGKNPSTSDKIVLEDSGKEKHVCDIISSDSKNFVIRLYEGITSGTFNVYYRSKSGKDYLKGQMDILVSNDPDKEGIELGEGVTLYGKVTCEGKGLEGVVVSDGVEVVATDSEGVYQIRSDKRYGYVFVSLPSGYATGGDGFLPSIHKRLMQAASAVERADFSLVRDGDQTNHVMLVFGDMHLANRNRDLEQFGAFTKDVNDYVARNTGKKVYGQTLGDLTWDIYWQVNKYDLENYVTSMSDIKGIKVFQAIGNHDHSCYLQGDFASATPFSELIAPTFYSYNIGKVHYVVLDDIVADNTGDYDGPDHGRNHVSKLSNDNIEWLRRDLSFVPKSTPVIISMHAPLYSDLGLPSVGNSLALISALEGYQVHLLTGHSHKMYNVDKQDSNGIFEHNSAAVCATWWWTGKNVPGVHICQDGTPGGYRVLNVNGTDVSWFYKATGSSDSYQFRTYDGNEVYMPADTYCPKANASGKALYEDYAEDWLKKSDDNYVYVNVWDYDPSWTVSVTENGESLKCEKLSSRTDPLHILVYTAPSINGNSKKPTFPTSKTRHIFRAQASSPNSTLEIKVTDRFGNVYSETMERPKAFNESNYKR